MRLQRASPVRVLTHAENSLNYPINLFYFSHDKMEALALAIDASLPASGWNDHRILVACSGGPDSTALVRLAAKRIPDPARLWVAHFNHRLRGTASDRDEQFVRTLCEQQELQSIVGHAQADQFDPARINDGLEAAARQARYQYLLKSAEELGARYLLTGHTADDHVETVLYHVLRGTGLAGLSGIPAMRPATSAVTIVRPLHGCRRSQLLTYLDDLAQTYCDDEHNQELKFCRNRIRHELLPWLEQNFHSSVHDSLLNLSRIAGDAQQVIRGLAEDLADEVLTEAKSTSVQLDTRRLKDVADHLLRELFVVIWNRQRWPQQAMSFAHWQRLATLAGSSTEIDCCNLPGGLRAQRNDCHLSITIAADSAPRMRARQERE